MTARTIQQTNNEPKNVNIAEKLRASLNSEFGPQTEATEAVNITDTKIEAKES